MPKHVILDGALGTELVRRGLPTPLPLWSAAAIDSAPDLLSEIHRDYAAAGATVHTANTFRTGPWTADQAGLGTRWQEWTRRAVHLARAAVPDSHRVAGSMAPLEDCWHPERSPEEAACRRAHGAMASALARAGVDLLLVETFANPAEALTATRQALETGLPVWLSMTQGPSGNLVADECLLETLAEAVQLGVDVVLLNCMRSEHVERLLPRLGEVSPRFGAYANVGEPCPDQGWRSPGQSAPRPYAEAARRWLDAGATVLGGCCGTSPAHVAALAQGLQST